MNFNAKKLEADINNITGICNEGKKSIKRLFENHFGVEFKKAINPVIGQIWRCQSGDSYLVASDDFLLFIDKTERNTYRSIGHLYKGYSPNNPFFSCKENHKVADSVEEYFEKKFNREIK